MKISLLSVEDGVAVGGAVGVAVGVGFICAYDCGDLFIGIAIGFKIKEIKVGLIIERQ